MLRRVVFRCRNVVNAMIDLTQRTKLVQVRKIKRIERIDINKVVDVMIANQGRNGAPDNGIVDPAKKMVHPSWRQKVDGQGQTGGDVDQVRIVRVNPPVLPEAEKKRHHPEPDLLCKKTGDHVFYREGIIDIKNP